MITDNSQPIHTNRKTSQRQRRLGYCENDTFFKRYTGPHDPPAIGYVISNVGAGPVLVTFTLKKVEPQPVPNIGSIIKVGKYTGVLTTATQLAVTHTHVQSKFVDFDMDMTEKLSREITVYVEE